MALLPRLATAALLLSALAACGGSGSGADGERLSVAATAVPHAEILEVVKPLLAAQGVDLQVRVFNDYVQPNTAVEDGAVDANYFQHLPYLEDFNAQNGTHIASIAAIHVEPMGLYGGKQTTLDALSTSAQ